MAKLADEQRKLEKQSSAEVAAKDASSPFPSSTALMGTLAATIAGSALLSSAGIFASSIVPVLGPALATLLAARILTIRKRSTTLSGDSHADQSAKDTELSKQQNAPQHISPSHIHKDLTDDEWDAELKNLLASMAAPISAGVKDKRVETNSVAASVPQGEIDNIRKLASQVFGTDELGISWLVEPNLAMGNQSPIQLLGDATGFAKVQNLLLRIQYGVLA